MNAMAWVVLLGAGWYFLLFGEGRSPTRWVGGFQDQATCEALRTNAEKKRNTLYCVYFNQTPRP